MKKHRIDIPLLLLLISVNTVLAIGGGRQFHQQYVYSLLSISFLWYRALLFVGVLLVSSFVAYRINLSRRKTKN